VRRCVVRRLVRRLISRLMRCSFISYWKIYIGQLKIRVNFADPEAWVFR